MLLVEGNEIRTFFPHDAMVLLVAIHLRRHASKETVAISHDAANTLALRNER